MAQGREVLLTEVAKLQELWQQAEEKYKRIVGEYFSATTGQGIPQGQVPTPHISEQKWKEIDDAWLKRDVASKAYRKALDDYRSLSQQGSK